jgi:hypothetical protein
MAEDCEKKAADLAFDVTKQFLTLALAGIAFVVGLSFNTPGAVSSLMLWLTVVIFGLSAVFGLFFLLHGVNLLSEKKTYDVYASSLRFLSIVQIAMVLLGAALLVPIVTMRPASRDAAASGTIEVKSGPQQGVVYRLDPGRDITIEVDGGKVKVTAPKK